MLIKDNKIYSLNHRAYFLCGGQSPFLLAASENGNISLIDLEKHSTQTIDLPFEIRGISFSLAQKLISLIEAASGGLTIIDFQGNTLFDEKAPALKAIHQTTEEYGFAACYFDESRRNFWCLMRLTDDTVEIQLRRSEGYLLTDKITLEDTFGQSNFSFHETGIPGLLTLWAGGGQDGQQVYWLKTVNEKIILHEEPALTDTLFPVFFPNGRDFLVVRFEENTVERYQYPDVKTGSCQLDFADEEDSFENIGCISDTLAIVITAHGRIFLLDTPEMKLIDELIIENREPRPTSYYYPNLKDKELCTDLSFAGIFGDNLIFVYQRNENTNLQDRQDNLVIIPKESILTKVSGYHQLP